MPRWIKFTSLIIRSFGNIDFSYHYLWILSSKMMRIGTLSWFEWVIVMAGLTWNLSIRGYFSGICDGLLEKSFSFVQIWENLASRNSICENLSNIDYISRFEVTGHENIDFSHFWRNLVFNQNFDCSKNQ